MTVYYMHIQAISVAIGISSEVYLGAVISAIILLVLTVGVTA